MSQHDATVRDYFETLHQVSDPFGYRSRWYEARKRQVLLATLPQSEFASGWEMGCSNGELTAALAPRCQRLLATDIAEHAVQHARQRVADLPSVSVTRMSHPAQWPEGRFDLIVMSEVGYYLSRAELADTIDKLRGSLAEAGILVACHWLHPFSEAAQGGRQVHDQLAAAFGTHRRYGYQDSDFLLEAWGGDSDSIAQREGLR